MVKINKINNRYNKLIKIINEHNLLYHTYDSPEISDHEYDSLYAELKEIENNNPNIISIDSPTQRVGSELLEYLDKKKHDTPMLSLSNAGNENDFTDFYNKLLSTLKLKKIELFAEPKFDGLAVNINYINGKYDSATTRGDGFIGEDVTSNVKTIRSLPMSIDNQNLPKTFSLRGEIFIDKKDFNKINQSLLKNNQKEYSNPRNLAAGSIRQLDPSIADSRNLRLFIHGVSDFNMFQNFSNHNDLIMHLHKIGFPVNKYSRVLEDFNLCIKYFENMSKIRDEIPYEIDGLVYRVNNFKLYDKLGFTSKSPKWAIAYKFKSLEALTKIIDVTFQVGRTGTITPVAELSPINIGGVTVSRATLHNFSEIRIKDININDYVYVKRAGDVIPDIDRVDLSKRKKIKKIIPPKKCPACGSILEKVENQVAYKCLNSKKCPPQIQQSIIHFISRKAMNIQGIGNQIIKELVEKKIIKRSSDLYKISSNDFKKLDRVGTKSIHNYLSSIELSKKVEFSKFIYALGIKEVGESSSRSIANNFNSIEEFLYCKYDQLVQINDIGAIVATNIKSFLADKDNLTNINDLINLGLDIKYTEKNNHKSTVVITGTFDNYSRSNLTDIFEANGFKLSSSVSKKTTILICGKKPGSKLTKAQDLDVDIIYEEELPKLLSKFH